MSIAMAGKEIKLDKESMSEIPADDSASGSEGSDFEDYFEEQDEEKVQQ